VSLLLALALSYSHNPAQAAQGDRTSDVVISSSSYTANPFQVALQSLRDAGDSTDVEGGGGGEGAQYS